MISTKNSCVVGISQTILGVVPSSVMQSCFRIRTFRLDEIPDYRVAQNLLHDKYIGRRAINIGASDMRRSHGRRQSVPSCRRIRSFTTWARDAFSCTVQTFTGLTAPQYSRSCVTIRSFMAYYPHMTVWCLRGEPSWRCSGKRETVLTANVDP